MNIRDWAKGHWPRIIAHHLGDEFTNTRKHQPCPQGEGTDRYRFHDKSGDGNFYCACSNGAEDGMKLLMCAKGMDFAQACKAVEDVIGPCPKDGEELAPKPQTWAERLRSETVRTSRSAYLRNRGLEVPASLGWHKSLAYFDADGNKTGEFPAMLAPVYRGSQFLTYHVTYLKGGQKAPVDPCRKILPAHSVFDGAACPLYPVDGQTLGIAEGIETAIAAHMLFDLPVWSALNTSILTKWRPPEGVTRVEIFGDNDENYAGHAAAYTLAHRLAKRGVEVAVRIPTSTGDWNDFLGERGKAA